MTAAEKAKELVQVYYQPLTIYLKPNNNNDELWAYAKSCAIIAIDFAIDAILECSVVAGRPLDEYRKIKAEINKL